MQIVLIKKTYSDASSIEIIGTEGYNVIELGDPLYPLEEQIFANIIIDGSKDSLTIHDTSSVTTKPDIELRPRYIYNILQNPNNTISYIGIVYLGLDLGKTAAGLTVVSTVPDISVTITTQDDDDVISVVNVQGDLTVISGNGNDKINVTSTKGNLHVISGIGTHEIIISETAGIVDIELGNGSSHSIIAHDTGGSLSVAVGTGDSMIDAQDTSNGVDITTGDVTVDEVVVGVLRTAQGGVSVTTGSGTHYVDILLTESGDATVTSGGGIRNEITILETNGGNAIVDSGIGPHIILVQDTSNNVSIQTAGGDNACPLTSDVNECGCSQTNQTEYRGWINETAGGLTCQAWDSQHPHSHNTTPQDYPYSGLEGNYCRNPNNRDGGSWCFTTSTREWDYCNVPKCIYDEVLVVNAGGALNVSLTGPGDDNVTVDHVEGDQKIITDAGDDFILIVHNGIDSHLFINGGSGDDIFQIDYLGGDGEVYGMAGDDLLLLDGRNESDVSINTFDGTSLDWDGGEGDDR